MLPNIINVDQTGYVKGRYIGENIRLIQDVLHFTNLTQQKGIAIFLDFKKSFDWIEWPYLNAALELFKFGPDILSKVGSKYFTMMSLVASLMMITLLLSSPHKKGSVKVVPFEPYASS